MALYAKGRPVTEGTLLWEPPDELKEGCNLARYMEWLAETRGLAFGSYDELWRWSVSDVEAFWASIWDYFQISSGQIISGRQGRAPRPAARPPTRRRGQVLRPSSSNAELAPARRAAEPYARVLQPSSRGTRVEGAHWFAGTELNYAEHCFRPSGDRTALIFANESGHRSSLTYAQLEERVAEVAAGLRRLGVGRDDCVAAFMPNIPEAVIAALAAASVGAAWSSCPPEFGVKAVIDRFRQLSPKVLLAVDGYAYNGKDFDALPAVQAIERGLPSVERTFVLPYRGTGSPAGLTRGARWEDLLAPGSGLSFERVPFDHPLWILYSSGTTGAPKAIVHGHGGALLEHLKALSLHMNLSEDDQFFWFTTTGWMMWNFLLSGLLVGAAIVLYDGSPAYPDQRALWRLASGETITCFGVSAPYILGCMKAGVTPNQELDLRGIRTLGSTGSPLPPEAWAWVYENVNPDLMLASISGGTDVVTAFTLPCPLLPVHAGEMQARALGCKLESWDEAGRPLIDEVGELVVTEPMPSMPVRFLNDPDGRRLHESYFDVYPDVWRHGDWVKVTARGTCVVYGRSDSTLKRGGVRMGTGEFYRVVEDLPEVQDSLVIDTSRLGDEGRLLLFVVLGDGVSLDDTLRARINAHLRRSLSPRHVPDAIYAITEVPKTLNGKKVEVPVRRILTGTPAERAAGKEALANPAALDYVVELAKQDSS